MRISIGMAVCGLAAVLLTAPFAGAGHAQSVLTYHNDPGRSGRFVVPALSWARARGVRLDPTFAPRFAGHLYAQPLYWQPAGAASGRLIVATEDDAVAAIDAGTGRTVWTRRLGQPVPLSALACGNIDPLGITGTPVIDAASKSLYLDAMTGGTAAPRHLIFALSLEDGAPLPGWPVDVEAALAARGLTFHARYQNQRGALAILGGRVFVPYGGHLGDCGDYHGWVVGVALGNPSDIVAWHTTAAKGGIWAPGGIASDGQRLIFATGNTEGARRWGDGEAVFRLTPALARSDRTKDFFAAADWRTLDAEDADLGGTNPITVDLPTGGAVQPLIVALGKDARAYLLDRGNLGGVGGQLRAETVSTGAIRTAPAAYPAGRAIRVAFEGAGAKCPERRANDALTVLDITADARPVLTTAWCGAFAGEGAPIVTTTDGRSNPIVWVLGAEGDERLHGFSGDSGAVLFDGGRDNDAMRGLRHFETLIATNDRLYVGGDGRLYAFRF